MKDMHNDIPMRTVIILKTVENRKKSFGRMGLTIGAIGIGFLVMYDAIGALQNKISALENDISILERKWDILEESVDDLESKNKTTEEE